MDDIAKLVKEFKQEVREKAIDEFVEALYKKATDTKSIWDTDYGMIHYEEIIKIAEQLKGEK